MRYWEARTPYEERELRGGLSMVAILIILNVAILIVQLIFYSQNINLENVLGLVPSKAIGDFYVWQFITYSFLHDTHGVLHLLLNMAVLYIFGRELEYTYGGKKFLAVYLACGIYGGLAFTVYQYIAGAIHIPVIGASGAVNGILVVYAMTWPNVTLVFPPVKVWIFVLIYVALDFFYTLANLNTGIAYADHLGGEACGFLIYLIEPHVEDYFFKTKAKIDRIKFLREFELQKEVDEILDKINKQGMQSLTPYEKKILDRASKAISKRG